MTSVTTVVAAAQVPLELARDGVAAGLGQVGGVPGLLQRPHVVGHLVVVVGQLVDTALPRQRLLLEVAGRDGQVERVLDCAQQGKRRLGARGLGHVVGHSGPEGEGLDPCAGEALREGADDAGRPLVAGQLDTEPLGDRGVGGHRGHRYRSGVRRVGKQAPDGDDAVDIELEGQTDDLADEGAPPHAWLDPADDDQVGASRDSRRA